LAPPAAAITCSSLSPRGTAALGAGDDFSRHSNRVDGALLDNYESLRIERFAREQRFDRLLCLDRRSSATRRVRHRER